MAQNEAKIKFIAETGEFNNELSRINASFKELTSQVRLVSASMDSAGGNTDQLKQKQSLLRQQIELLDDKQAQLNGKLQAAESCYDENSVAITSLKTDINNVGVQQANLKTQLALTTTELQKQESAFGQLEAEITQLEAELKQAQNEYKSMVIEYGKGSTEAKQAAQAVERLSQELAESKAKMNSAESAAEQLDYEMDDLGHSATAASDGFTVARMMLSNFLTDAVYMGINKVKELSKEVVDLGMNFTYSMREVQAISSATSEELDLLTDTAREMGATTRFSATDGASALKFMALAGWDAQQMVAGIPGVMNLAAASNMDLATASSIVTDNVAAFNMTAADSAMFADRMAYAMSNANTDIVQLGEAYKYVAATATGLGYTMEETTAAIMVMSDAGIKGSMAGTGLAAIMTRLGNDTAGCRSEIASYGVEVYDAEGNVASLSSILDGMRGIWANLSEEQRSNLAYTVAGRSAQSQLMTIMNESTGSFAEYTEGLRNCNGAAVDMSNTMNDSLQGDIWELQSALEEIGLSLFEELEEPLRSAAQTLYKEAPNMGKKLKEGLKVGVDVAISLSQNLDKVVASLVALGIAMNAQRATTMALNIYQQASAWIAAYNAALKAEQTVTEAVTIATKGMNLALASNPVGLVVAVLATLASVLFMVSAATDDVEEKTSELDETISASSEAVKAAAEAQGEYRKSLEESTAAELSQVVNVESLTNELMGLVDAHGYVDEANRARVDFILGELNEALGTEYKMTDGVIEKYSELKDSVYDLIKAKQAEIMLESQERAYRNAIENRAAAEAIYYQASEAYSRSANELKDLEVQQMMMLKDAGFTTYSDMLEYIKTYQLGAKTAAQEEIIANQEKIDSLKDTVSQTQAELETAKGVYLGYTKDITLYEAMQKAALEGNTAEVIRLYQEQSEAITQAKIDALKTYDEKLAALQEKFDTEKLMYDTLNSELLAGNQTVTQQMVDDAKAKMDAAQQNLNEFASTTPEQMRTGWESSSPSFTTAVGTTADEAFKLATQPDYFALGKEQMSNQSTGIKGNSRLVTTASTTAVSDANTAAKTEATKSDSIGQAMVEGMRSGVNFYASGLAIAAATAVKNALIAAKAEAGVSSPAKKWRRELGFQLPAGAAEGIEENDELERASARMVDRALSASLGSLKHIDMSEIPLNITKTASLQAMITGNMPSSQSTSTTIIYQLDGITYLPDSRMAELMAEVVAISTRKKNMGRAHG